MPVKTRIAVGAATFGLVAGGLGMAGTLTASAATPSCGGNCANIFVQKYGPKYLLDGWQGKAAAGTPVILFQKSNTDPAQDFVVKDLGTVGGFYTDYGLVTSEFAHTYSAYEAYEIQYEPYGLNSNFCVSTWPGEAPQPGYKVQLERCGAYSNSLWANDGSNETYDCRSGAHKLAGYNYDSPLINGADANFSNPEVLNYPAGNPTDMPRPQLTVQPENTYSDNTVFDNQEWGTAIAPVSSSARACQPDVS
jgi:hypothetical protein